MLSGEQNLLKKVVALLQTEYPEEFSNPYSVENFATDYLCNHSELAKTGLFFKKETQDCEGYDDEDYL